MNSVIFLVFLLVLGTTANSSLLAALTKTAALSDDGYACIGDVCNKAMPSFDDIHERGRRMAADRREKCESLPNTVQLHYDAELYDCVYAVLGGKMIKGMYPAWVYSTQKLLATI